MMLAHEDIRSLLELLSQGDEQAFRRIFDAYSSKVYGFALKLTRAQSMAEEIVQDVFMKVWINREAMATVDYFSSYLYTITRNHTFNLMKRVALEAHAKSALGKELSEAHRETEEAFIEKESRQILNQAIDRLPPQQRMVYSLCYQQGLKYEEVAQRLNISRLTVKTHMQQALRNIKLHFSGLISALMLFLI